MINITTQSLYLFKPLILLALILYQPLLLAYHPTTGHVPLTQVAIKKYNQCFDKNPITPATAKRIKQGNIAMDHGTLSFSDHDNNLRYSLLTFHYISRITNWHFYHPDKEHLAKQGKFQLSHKRLWQWAKLGLQHASKIEDKALFLGALIHLTEDLTVPAHVVPVYHGPVAINYLGDFKHLTQNASNLNSAPSGIMDIIKDNIDMIPVNSAKLLKQLHQDNQLCNSLTTKRHQNITPESIRHLIAAQTLNAIKAPIPACPDVSWQIFWPPMAEKNQLKQPTSAQYFHQYGAKFMSELKLKNPNCHMQPQDPRYQAFLSQRYQSAVKANMALLYWFMQTKH